MVTQAPTPKAAAAAVVAAAETAAATPPNHRPYTCQSENMEIFHDIFFPMSM